MGLLDDTVSRLRDVLATVEDIDLWPPWDAAQTIDTTPTSEAITPDVRVDRAMRLSRAWPSARSRGAERRDTAAVGA